MHFYSTANFVLTADCSLLSPSSKNEKKSTLKKFLIFSQKKVFLIVREMELSSPKIKKIQEGTFRGHKIKKTHSEKICYIFGNGTFYLFIYLFILFFLR